MKSEKKVFLLITEGPSDKTALEGPINYYLRAKKLSGVLECAVYHTDISTHRYGENDTLMSDPYEVDKNIIKCVRAFLNSPIDNPNKFTISNIIAVASLTDLDACYCRERDVKYCPELERSEKKTHVDCASKTIKCNNVLFIRKRNILKVESLGILSDTPLVIIDKHKIAYKAFYMSVNLEHALYDDTNQYTELEKNSLAEDFRSSVSSNGMLFYNIVSSIPRLSDNYKDTWDEKKLRKMPFDRLSNLRIMIDWLVKLLTECGETEDKSDE